MNTDTKQIMNREARQKQMKKRRIWNLAFLAVFVLLFVMQIASIVSIARLKMLPGILMALIILVFVVYDGIAAYFMFLRGMQKMTKRNAHRIIRKRRIIASVLAVIMVCGCAVVNRVTGDVYDTLQSLQASEQIQEEDTAIKRAVYVRTFDAAQTLEESANYNYGRLIHFDDENTQQAIDAIEAQLGTSIHIKEYTSIFDMANALLSGELDAVILSSSYTSVLEGDPQFAEFTSMTRILGEVEIEGSGEELDGAGLLLNAEVDIAENGKIKPFVVYISGSDSRVNSMQNNRSDVNIVVVVNPRTKQVLMINTPRDYYIPSTVAEGEMEKLSHAGVFGVKASIQSLEDLYDVEIPYYVQMSFGGVTGIVDAIGGVTIYSDEEFVLYEDVGVIKMGENHLNGQLALAYARTRKGVEGGDLGRGNHQMEIISAIIDQATSGTTILTNYAAIMQSVEGLFIMNIPNQLISALVREQLADMSGWNVASFSTYGEGGYGDVHSVPGASAYIITPDEASVTKASKLIDMALNDEIITADVVNSIT